MNTRMALTITGLVQGVGYRKSSQAEAVKRGLVGYVRNTSDGRVELVAQGDKESLKDFADWCYNGVESASVLEVQISWLEVTGEFSDFVIKS